MRNGFFLITGTSRGIGEALAQKILVPKKLNACTKSKKIKPES